MKIIKKSEKLTLKKMKEMEEAEDLLLLGETVDLSEGVVEEKPLINSEYGVISEEYKEPNYIPVRDNPLVQSVGNSGWQPSDIWREIRVDSFYDG
ncbi:MAG: hypothetical protein RMZ69_09855 [Nostoc sp. ChiQUE01a]|uniref:hypothetical protein n=1 Tax=Nostoc sp. CCY 9925 TaxID=3103865 RepID=UPI002ADC4E71|nr:hypothetical protein [Nostoc sp. DedQUE11]MDZ8237458.1 hypothetical protein [Nostoc sp. ChiQUE01a]